MNYICYGKNLVVIFVSSLSQDITMSGIYVNV